MMNPAQATGSPARGDLNPIQVHAGLKTSDGVLWSSSTWGAQSDGWLRKTVFCLRTAETGPGHAVTTTARSPARKALRLGLDALPADPACRMPPRRSRTGIIDHPPPSARTEGCAILHALSPRTARGAHSGRQSALRRMPREWHAGIMIESQKGTRDILPE